MQGVSRRPKKGVRSRYGPVRSQYGPRWANRGQQKAETRADPGYQRNRTEPGSGLQGRESTHDSMSLLFTFTLIITFYFLLFTFYFLLFTFYFLLFTFYFLLFTIYFLLKVILLKVIFAKFTLSKLIES